MGNLNQRKDVNGSKVKNEEIRVVKDSNGDVYEEIRGNGEIESVQNSENSFY